MSDIAKRLRSIRGIPDTVEGAKEIERLEAEVSRLAVSCDKLIAHSYSAREALISPMTDKIITDSIDLIVTKQDFIELMDDNAKQLDEIERLEAERDRYREALISIGGHSTDPASKQVAQKALPDVFALNGEQGG
jgi:uncharacterized small protein (DUF1192 family)